MPLKTVFFDLDGTLLDTSEDLGKALNRLRDQEGLPPIAKNVIRQQVSNGASALVRLGFGETLEESRLMHLRERLLAHYLEDIASATIVFPGIELLIEQLTEHGLSWGIVTNKPQKYTEALMRNFAFASVPVATVSPDQIGVGKPHPAPLLHACKLADCAPQAAVYIGDHQRDIECGHRAGVPTIAVGYGFTSDPDEHRSWQATHTADRTEHIWPILAEYRGK